MTAHGLPAIQRFLMKVEKTPTCWLWTAAKQQGGYGMFGAKNTKKVVAAHRWSYEHFVGPIPKGMQIDHLCRVRHCVNPAHLEPVTPKENLRRGREARRLERQGIAA